MAINNFIPTIWAANMIQAKDNAHVFARVANRQYEGEIRNFGDTVKVSQIGDVTVAAYTKNSTSITPQELYDAQTTLAIDKSYYFAFKIDDVDAAQSKPKVMQEAMRKSAYALADSQDAIVAALYASAGLTITWSGSTNSISNCVDMTSLNVHEAFLMVQELFLGYANVDPNKLFAIIPPWVYTKLVLAGIAIKQDNNALVVNGGFAGKMLGFNMYVSRNVSKNSSSWDITRIMCGVENETIAVAEQISSVEAYRPEASFSDAVKGLHLYGAKVMRPDLMCTLYADYTAEA